MHTTRLNIETEVTVVSTDAFLAELEADLAKADTRTGFQKSLVQAGITEGDALLTAVLKNGVRTFIRDELLRLLRESGMGGRVSPAKVTVLDNTESIKLAVASQGLPAFKSTVRTDGTIAVATRKHKAEGDTLLEAVKRLRDLHVADGSIKNSTDN